MSDLSRGTVCQQARRADFLPLEGVAQLSAPTIEEAAPGDEKCFMLWRKYRMLENVERHSLMVAQIAQDLAQRSVEVGANVDVASVRASALLHDIAKTWSLRHECSHAAIGAAWVIMDTRHYAVAQGVLLHVRWPWPIPEGIAVCQLPILVYYADKRVRHDQCVTIDERCADLLVR